MQLRHTMFDIIDVLFQEEYIGLRDYHLLSLEKDVYLVDKVKQFMEISSGLTYDVDSLE